MSVFWICHAESVANAGQATIDPGEHAGLFKLDEFGRVVEPVS